MSFRITTNGVFRNYRSNLQKSTKNLTNSMTRVQTQRAFNSYAEDPAAASRAFQMRRTYWLTGDQIDTSNYVISKFSSAYTAMEAIIDGDENTKSLHSLDTALRGLNDPDGGARNALGQQLLAAADSVVKMMNTQYGDDFLFAGADGGNVPFEWGENAKGEKTLLYRGVDVNTEKPAELSEFGLTEADLTGVDLNSLKEPNEADYALGQEDQYKADLETYNNLRAFKAYKEDYSARNGITYEQGAEDYGKLEKLADEPLYVDIGLGLREVETNGTTEFLESSGFDMSLSGVAILGYGRDKNLAVMMSELGELFLSADQTTGAYPNPEVDAARADELLNGIHSSISSISEQHVKLTTDTQFLNANLKQLETSRADLNEQIESTERLDPADAITEMTWAQYCYNAALRIGNNILSQSLLDYMN